MDELVQEIEAFCKAARMKPGALFRHAKLSRVTWHQWKNGTISANMSSVNRVKAEMARIKAELAAV